MIASCTTVMPTLSSNTATYDGFTFLRFKTPVTVTFSGLSSDCTLMRDVVLTPSNGDPGSTFIFTLDDAADDTLVFSSDDPTDEKTSWNL